MTRLTEAVLGFETTRESIDRTSTIGTTEEKVLDQNPNRLQVVFINPTSNTIAVDTSGQVTTTDGFTVPSSGGSVVFNVSDDGDLPTAEWHAVADAGGTTLVHRGEVVRGQLPAIVEEGDS